jgi:hypothetical protein
VNRRGFICALSGMVAWAKSVSVFPLRHRAVQPTCEYCRRAVHGQQLCVLADAYGASRWFHADCYSRHINETDPPPSDGPPLGHGGAWEFLGTTPLGTQVFGDSARVSAIVARAWIAARLTNPPFGDKAGTE